MNIYECQALAVSEMREHGLIGWTLSFDNSKTRAGECRYRKREISLSGPLMRLWPAEQCLDTIRHEIAHALTPGHNHDSTWQRECRRIGAKPDRCWDAEQESIPGRYLGTCPNGHTTTMHRITRKDRSCAKCSSRFDPRYLFTWTDTHATAARGATAARVS